jgi:hypothetical protein
MLSGGLRRASRDHSLSQKPREMSRLHFVVGDGCPDLAHLAEKIDRVPLTNMRWIDMRNPEPFQAFSGKLCIVSDIGE